MSVAAPGWSTVCIHYTDELVLGPVDGFSMTIPGLGIPVEWTAQEKAPLQPVSQLLASASFKPLNFDGRLPLSITGFGMKLSRALPGSASAKPEQRARLHDSRMNT